MGFEGGPPLASPHVIHGVGWLSRLSGVRQARPPQPRTLRLNPPHRRLRRAPRPRRMPSAPRARKWGSAHGCGKPVRSPRMPRTVSSAATPRAISVYDALQLFGTRVHEPRPPCAGEHAAVKADQCDPLGPPAGPAKSRERLFASAQVDDGSARRRVELLLQHTHATNGEEPFARKSTRGKRPIVSRRVRTVQTVLGPSDAAASGLPSDPRGASAVAFNKDQHIVVVGQRVTPEIRRTASFLGSKGIQVTCVEFTFFQAKGGGRLLSHEIVVGREHAKPHRVTSEARRVVSEEEFLNSCDENGEIVFSRILDSARRKSMSISWGTKGFSVGVDVDGTRVVVCYGYLPTSVFKQTLYTALCDRAGIQKKTGAPAEAVGRLRNSAEATGLFTPAGRDLKCVIDRAFTDDEVDKLVAWCEAVEQAIAQHGLNATPEQ